MDSELRCNRLLDDLVSSFTGSRYLRLFISVCDIYYVVYNNIIVRTIIRYWQAMAALRILMLPIMMIYSHLTLNMCGCLVYNSYVMNSALYNTLHHFVLFFSRQNFLDLLSQATNSIVQHNAESDVERTNTPNISSPPFIVPEPPPMSQLPEFEESQFSTEDSAPVLLPTSGIDTNSVLSKASGIMCSSLTAQGSPIQDSISNTISTKTIGSSSATQWSSSHKYIHASIYSGKEISQRNDPMSALSTEGIGEIVRSTGSRHSSKVEGKVRHTFSLPEDDCSACEDPLPGSKTFDVCSAMTPIVKICGTLKNRQEASEGVCSVQNNIERNQSAIRQAYKNDNEIISSSGTRLKINETVRNTPQGSKVTTATPSRINPRPDQPPGVQHDPSSSEPSLGTPSRFEGGVAKKTGISRTGDTSTPSNIRGT